MKGKNMSQDEEQYGLGGETVHGVKLNRWGWYGVSDNEPEPEPEPEPVVETPEPVVEPEPEMDWGTMQAIAKFHRKSTNNAITLAQAKQELMEDKNLLEKYKNLKKW